MDRIVEVQQKQSKTRTIYSSPSEIQVLVVVLPQWILILLILFFWKIVLVFNGIIGSNVMLLVLFHAFTKNGG